MGCNSLPCVVSWLVIMSTQNLVWPSLVSAFAHTKNGVPTSSPPHIVHSLDPRYQTWDSDVGNFDFLDAHFGRSIRLNPIQGVLIGLSPIYLVSVNSHQRYLDKPTSEDEHIIQPASERATKERRHHWNPEVIIASSPYLMSVPKEVRH